MRQRRWTSYACPSPAAFDPLWGFLLYTPLPGTWRPRHFPRGVGAAGYELAEAAAARRWATCSRLVAQGQSSRHTAQVSTGQPLSQQSGSSHR